MSDEFTRAFLASKMAGYATAAAAVATPATVPEKKSRKKKDPLAQALSEPVDEPAPMPEDRRTLTRKAWDSGVDTAASGLSAVGNLLDTPVSMVRDVLTWLPGGPAPANPFNQLLSPLSGEGRTTAKDFLRDYGIQSPLAAQGTAAKAGRFATEFAIDAGLDPLTYLTFGGAALTKTGATTAKAGLTQQIRKAASARVGRQLGPAESRIVGRVSDLGVSKKEAKRAAAAGRKPRVRQGVLDRLQAAAESEGTTVDELFKADEALGGQVRGMGPLRWAMEKAGVGAIPTGETAQAVARFTDDLGRRLVESGPGRRVRSLFDRRVMGMTSKAGQELGQGITEAQDALQVKAREEFAPLMREFDNTGILNGPNANDNAFRIRQYLEDTTPQIDWNAAPQELQDLDAQYKELRKNVLFDDKGKRRQWSEILPEDRQRLLDLEEQRTAAIRTSAGGKNAWLNTPELQKIQPLLDDANKRVQATLPQSRGEGVQVSGLDDVIGYFPRQAVGEGGPMWTAARNKRKFGPSDPNAMQRGEELRGFEGGTAMLQEMSLDPEFAGMARRRTVSKKYQDKAFYESELARFADRYGLNDPTARELAYHGDKYDDRVRDLFNTILHRDPKNVDSKVAMYANNPMDTAYQRVVNAGRAQEVAKGARRFVKDNVRLVRDVDQQLPPPAGGQQIPQPPPQTPPVPPASAAPVPPAPPPQAAAPTPPPPPVRFQPTDQWQDVPDNALLPPGLEVRLDVSTGRKQARAKPKPPAPPAAAVAPAADDGQELYDAVSKNLMEAAPRYKKMLAESKQRKFTEDELLDLEELERNIVDQVNMMGIDGDLKVGSISDLRQVLSDEGRFKELLDWADQTHPEYGEFLREIYEAPIAAKVAGKAKVVREGAKRVAASPQPQAQPQRYTRDQFRADVKSKFKLNDAKTDAVVAITDARAGVWAKYTGKKADEWYGAHLAKVTDESGMPVEVREAINQQRFQGNNVQGVTSWGDDSLATIGAITRPNVTTAVHEVGHVFRKDLERVAESAEDVAQDLAKLNEVYGVPADGKWTRANEEAFARDLEKYVSTGKTEIPELKGVFEKFKEWFRSVYKKIKGTPLERELHPEVRHVFERMLGLEKPTAPTKAMPGTREKIEELRRRVASGEALHVAGDAMKPPLPPAATKSVLKPPVTPGLSGPPKANRTGNAGLGGRVKKVMENPPPKDDTLFQSTPKEQAKAFLDSMIGKARSWGKNVTAERKGPVNMAPETAELYEQKYSSLLKAFEKDPTWNNDTWKGRVLADLPGDMVAQARQAAVQRHGLKADETPNLDQILDELALPQSRFDDFVSLRKTFQSPDEVGYWVAAWDAVTNFWKLSNTAIDPSFHVRNVTGAFFRNVTNGMQDPFEKGWKKYTQPIADAHQLVTGGEISNANKIGLLKKKTNREATQQIADWAFAYGLVDSPGRHQDIVGATHGHVTDYIPGKRNLAKDIVAPFKKDPITGKRQIDWNPLNTKGVRTQEDRFVGARVARATGNLTESYNRMAPFIAYLKQGYSPEVAARKVLDLQIDYGNLSQFEKRVMRRVMPFYSFSRGAAPSIAKELAQRPGGPLGQTIRASNLMRDKDTTTPDYIAETTAIPFPFFDKGDGSKKYITGFGLMHEDPVSMVGSPKQVGFDMLGRLNPMIKAPVEYFTGVSLFQRAGDTARPLRDMDPLLGRLAANVTGSKDAYQFGSEVETVVSNSPLARILSRARQITDPRKSILDKALSVATGIRITNVSPEAQDAILREKLAEELRRLGGRTFDRDYFPKDKLNQLAPQDRNTVEQIQGVMNELAKRAKERKALKEAAAE